MNLIRVKKPGYFMQDIQEEINNMLEDAFENFGLVGLRTGRQETFWRPAIEVYEQNGNYQLKAELPGINKENIDIEVGEDSITVKGQIKRKEEEKKDNIYRSELRYGKFMRTVPLPTKIDNINAKAEFKDGILTITVPKTKEEEQKFKKITIEE
ncbi:MAG: Hsp20/alpha crystallin family protein [bacterium]